MVSITAALRTVKDDLPRMIEHHVATLLNEAADHVWRQRLLDPITTVMLFTMQVMHGNTAINHLRHLAGRTFTAAAYCNARKRLPMTLLEELTRRITRELLPESDDACRWRGHRMWRADATSFSMPDTPALQQHFGQPGGQLPGCGFPVATLLTLCNAAGFIVKTLALPMRTHEASQITELHDELEAGDVLVYDRAGCSYAHLALLFMGNLHAIFRMHQKQIVSFRPHRKHTALVGKHQRKGKPSSQWLARLGKHDQHVRWFKPNKPKWMAQEQYDTLPASLELRELRYTIRRKGFRTRTVTLVTTLLDAQQYPTHELAEQYRMRWDIELNFRHLKTTMGMEVLKCKSVEGVLKELAVFTLVYNLMRLVMLRASQRQKVPLHRISFIDALRWLRTARAATDLELIVNPRRADRLEPRVLKRRMKEYDLMKQPRHELRQRLLHGALAA